MTKTLNDVFGSVGADAKLVAQVKANTKDIVALNAEDIAINVRVKDNSDNIESLTNQLTEAQSKISELEKLKNPAFGHTFDLIAKVYPAGTKDYIKFRTNATIQRNMSIPDDATFVITRTGSGLYKVSAEIVLDDSNARQMPQVFAETWRDGVMRTQRRILLAYTPTNGVGNQANGYQTISGSGYFNGVAINDIIRFRLDATNGATVSLYAGGALTVEEI